MVSVSGDRPSARRLLADLLEPRRVAVPSRAAWSAVVFRRIEVEPLRLRDCPMNGARTDRTGGAEQDGRDRFEEIVAALDRDRRSRLKNEGKLVIGELEHADGSSGLRAG